MSLVLKRQLQNFGFHIKEAVLYFAYPPKCLHCHTPHMPLHRELCENCASHLSLLDTSKRCLFCFRTFSAKGVCFRCRQYPGYLSGYASSCEYQGPIKSLLCKFKYSNYPYLAKGLGALLAAQFLQLGWEMPDFIVPVPISWLKRFDRGYNQCELLAQELGTIIQKPVRRLLKRRSGDWSQAGLSFNQRKELTSERFYLAENKPLYDKTVLLIDDVATTGRTLQCCAEVLAEACPAKIYALTVAQA